MIKKAFACCGLTLASFAVFATDWEYPDDIPKAEPVYVGLAGEKPADIVRYLFAQGTRGARLSPDGKTVAFELRVSGEPQLWLVDAAGGWPQQLTFGNGITFFEWSPDSQQLLVARDADGNEREGYYLLSKDGTQERLLLPKSDAFRAFGMFSADGSRFLYSSTERNGTDFDIYLHDIESSETRMAYQGTFGFFPQAWQPGGDLVIVTETRGEDAQNVYLLDISSGEIKPLFKPEVAAQYSDFVWLPDGSGFYMATNVDREFAALAFYSLADRKLELIDAPESDIGNVSLAENGRYLFWTRNDFGYSRPMGIDRSSGDTLDIPPLPPGRYYFHAAADAATVSVRVSGPATPGDVFVWNATTGKTALAVRSSLAGIDPDSFVVPAHVHYQARDGLSLHGLLYLPNRDDFPDPPPVVIDVHGGPTGQSRPEFEAEAQYLVNNGIAVFFTNVRGSTGYGKTFARLDNQEKRLESVRDLVDTVTFLATDTRVDTTRIAVMGGSYGGYMVNAVLGMYPGVFDAGISRVGVSDWVRALQDASPALKASDRIEYGDIREERWQEFYAANSPINTASKIDVPVLIEHGANDPRDPVEESDRIVRAIRDAGGTVRYLRFPDEGHSIVKLKNRAAYYRAISEFLAENLFRDSDSPD